MTLTRDHLRRLRLAALGMGLAVATAGAVLLLILPAPSGAAPQVAPANNGEPRITGTPRVGQVQRATRGSWTGTEPMDFTYRWYRCLGRGAPDASDCRRISNAGDNTYVARAADAGFRLRVQVTATNDDGSDTATSNPTEPIQSARPANSAEPSISGTPTVGSTLTASRGSWVGETPITYAFQWLRCGQDGTNCSEIAGATDNRYTAVANDAGRTLRVRVTARNDVGSRSALSNPTAVVRGQSQPPPPPPTGNFVDARNLEATGDRMVVNQVRFLPNPVTSRVTPITVRIKVTDQRARPVRGALVFIRSVPRRTTGGDRQLTGSDGWVEYRLQPLRHFPAVNGNVQFFVKAYRAGDPPLGGVAGYRLVQVRVFTANDG